MPEMGGTGRLEQLGSSPQGEQEVHGLTLHTLVMVEGSCGQKHRKKPKPSMGDWVAHGNNSSFWMSPPVLRAVGCWQCWTPLPTGSGACIALQHLHPASSSKILTGTGKPILILAGAC